MTSYNSQAFMPGFSTFKSERVVRAAEITAIHSDTCVGIGPYKVSVTYDPKGKPTPSVGWFVICYEDGYVSFCPPESFWFIYSRPIGRLF